MMNNIPHPHPANKRLVVVGKTFRPGFPTLEMTLANDPLWHPRANPKDSTPEVDGDLIRKQQLEERDDEH